MGKLIIEPAGSGKVLIVLYGNDGERVGDAELNSDQWTNAKILIDERIEKNID